MELHGTGFKLRGWKLTDAGAMQRNADNINVAQFLLDRFPSPYTMADAEAWVQRWQNQNPMVNFAITVDDEVIGGIGLEFRQDIYRHTPLIGYWLAEPYWGRGIMPQAVKLISKHAFENLGAICILAYVLSKNPASMRVMEKSGFVQQGMIKQSVIKNVEVLDEYIYALSPPTP